MAKNALTEKITNHYDVVSPFYKNLWGRHIHHGYYETGKETKEEATENLLRFLVYKSRIQPKSEVLDIGCGIGGTAVFLAENFDCNVTGVTISPVQIEIAEKESAKLGNRLKFLIADANNLPFIGKFDAVLAIECISHLTDKESFFKNASRMIKNNGIICIADWLKAARIDKDQKNRYIKPIESGMLVSLETKDSYFGYLKSNRLKLKYYEDISSKVRKTWDLALEIIKNKALWKLAIRHGKDALNFLKAFKAMKNGFSSGALVYGVFIAKK